MSSPYADRIKETSFSTGTGAIDPLLAALVAAVPGCDGAFFSGDAASYQVSFSGVYRNATPAEITAAQAIVSASAVSASQLGSLRTQAIAAISQLRAIENASAPTNAQVIAAVKTIATILDQLIQVVGQAIV